MKRALLIALSGMLILAAGSSNIWAQATAQVSGTVRDQSGAVLPGVEVTATQTDTGIARTTVTNETGSYVLPNLPLGPYRVEASLPGFRTFAQTGIVLQVNSSPLINPVLQVGEITESVEVQANAELVEVRSQGIGQVIESTRILELPLEGRNVTDLITLAGATTPGNPGFGASRSSGNMFNTTGVSVAGGATSGLSFVLDGAIHNNPSNNLEMPLPFPDALQEFKVESSAVGAQSGMHAAGAVNAVTKSGTNQIHGDLFEFVRNYKFNARNFFAVSRDSLKRNQFGGTVGGPIIRNRLFFFAGYQGTLIRQDPSDSTAFVPTAAMLAGDFTAFASPACNQGRQIALRAPFVNNRISPAMFSPVTVAFAQRLPKSDDPCGRILFGSTVKEDNHQAVGKIDYQWSANHSLFGRYIVTSILSPHPYEISGKNLLATNQAGADALSQGFTFGSTYLFGPNVVNALRMAANRQGAQRLGGTWFSWSELGAKVYDGYNPGYSLATVSGGGGFSVSSAGAAPGRNNWSEFSLHDDVSVLRGSHQFGFGAVGARWDVNYITFAAANIRPTFNGQVTGLGMADFLLGEIANVQAGNPNWYPSHQWHVGAYAQDTWQVTPRLTLNAGLRWEPFLPLQFIQGAAWFDLDRFKSGIRSTVFPKAPPGLYWNGDPGHPGDAGINKRWQNWSPRVGLGWDATGDGRMSIRAAFGTFYEFPPTTLFVGLVNSPPWAPRIVLNNVKVDDPWLNYPGGNPFPITIGPESEFPLGATYRVLRPDTQNTSVHQWNLSIQRQVGTDWMVSGTYLGSNTVHLWLTLGTNPAVYIPGASTTANTNQRRVLSLMNPNFGQFFANMNTVDDGGTASYHGMTLSVQRRPARGTTVSANYTWSHCITDPFSGASLPGGTAQTDYQDPPGNRRTLRGNCSNSAVDIRHVFNLTAVAETPQFSNRGLRAVATGWRLSPILRLRSGSFFDVTTNQDRALTDAAPQRVNQLMSNVYGDKSSVINYLNRQAFAEPDLGTVGNMGVSSVRGPGFWQLDAALSRTLSLGEVQRLEFRAEAFNITNSLRMNNPDANFRSSRFGEITSAYAPRVMQFALKYVF